MSSTRQNPAEQAKALASQLKCPMGDTGQELAHSLNLGNLHMIVSALNALGIEEDDRILEAGPGNGGLLNYVLSLAENLHYDGVEISPLMYEQARATNNVFIAEGLAEYALYDGVNLPYEDGIFTKVLSVNTVYFWEEPAWLLAEMCRVLTAGGRVCLSFCEKDFMKTLRPVRCRRYSCAHTRTAATYGSCTASARYGGGGRLCPAGTTRLRKPRA